MVQPLKGALSSMTFWYQRDFNFVAPDREADCRIKAGESNDAMNAYHNAAKSYKKSDPEGELSRTVLSMGL